MGRHSAAHPGQRSEPAIPVGGGSLQALEALRGSPADRATHRRSANPIRCSGAQKELSQAGRSVALRRGGRGQRGDGFGRTGNRQDGADTLVCLRRSEEERGPGAGARGVCGATRRGRSLSAVSGCAGSLLQSPGRERVVALLRRHAPTWCLQFPAVFSSGHDGPVEAGSHRRHQGPHAAGTGRRAGRPHRRNAGPAGARGRALGRSGERRHAAPPGGARPRPAADAPGHGPSGRYRTQQSHAEEMLHGDARARRVRGDRAAGLERATSPRTWTRTFRPTNSRRNWRP